MNEETKSTTTGDVVTEQDKGRCAPEPGSAWEMTLDAYHDLINGPVPVHDQDYRRAIRLAVLIGIQVQTHGQETPNKE